MTTIEIVEKPNPFTLRTGLRMGGGAVLGAIIGFGCVELAKYLHVPVKSFAWQDTLALFLAIVCAGIGIVTWLVSFNRKEVARNLEGEGALPATNAEVRAVRLQAASLFLAGVMMLLPLVAMGTAQIPGGAATIFGFIVMLFIAQTVANIRLWQISDEFLRRQILLTGCITFFVGQSALFLWAAAEHMHFAPPVSSWAIMMLVMTLYLGVGTFLSIQSRR